MQSQKKKNSWWVNYVNQHAGNSELEQICRPNTNFWDFTVMVNDIRKKLAPGGNGKLLDVGAGNGLIDILIEDMYKSIVAVEPATEIFNILNFNTALFPNIKPINCHAEELNEQIGNIKFDQMLMYSVSAQLDSPEIIYDILEPALTSMENKSDVFIGSVNNLAHRDDYLRQLPEILESKGFEKEKVQEIMEKNYKASWHDFEEMQRFLSKFGYFAEKLPTYPLHTIYQHKYDVVAHR